MTFNERALDDYIDVAQRIADFRVQYPDGTLQPADPAQPWRIVQAQSEWCRRCVGNRSVKINKEWRACPRCEGSGIRGPGEPTLDSFVVVAAAAYRTPDDPRPGIGLAWEPYPGQTPYTLGSELMNAETSAWGRAIIAVGASDSKRGIASREEVRNRQAERDDNLPTNRDGSLSRSRTTDEEKDAAGVMTDGQLKAHNKVRREGTPDSAVEKLGTTLGTDDPWLDGPAGLAPQDDPEDRPGSATAEQIKAIQTLYSAEFKITDRAAKLETTRKFLGIDMLPSHTRLSYRQAGDLLLAMRHKLGTEKAAKA